MRQPQHGRTKQLTAVVSNTVYSLLIRWAEHEHRSISGMAGVLLVEALNARALLDDQALEGRKRAKVQHER